MKNININALAKLLGINPNTLRGWERRYQAVEPGRRSDGQRLYSRTDIERVRLLVALVRKGHSIGNIAKLPTKELREMLESSDEIEGRKPVPPDSPGIVDSRVLTAVRALERFDLQGLGLELTKARFELSTLELISDFIYPLMRRVGELVNEGRLTIAQEHLLSALLRDFLGGIHQSLSPYELSARQRRERILICSREGDIHEFGILISAILVNLNRYQSLYLGTSMPLADLVEACDSFKVDALVLGLMKIGREHGAVASESFVRELDRLLPKRIALLVGGSDAQVVEKLKTKRKIYRMKDLLQLNSILAKGF